MRDQATGYVLFEDADLPPMRGRSWSSLSKAERREIDGIIAEIAAHAVVGTEELPSNVVPFRRGGRA